MAEAFAGVAKLRHMRPGIRLVSRTRSGMSGGTEIFKSFRRVFALRGVFFVLKHFQKHSAIFQAYFLYLRIVLVIVSALKRAVSTSVEVAFESFDKYLSILH